MSPADATQATPWIARPCTDPHRASPVRVPGEVDDIWRPLGQAWRRDGLEPAFNPGWARLRWQGAHLALDALFLGRNPRNRARDLNQRTWELGDICELFLLAPDGATYVEIHVTPENQRLQLRWPRDGLARFRAGTAALEDFLIPDPAWIATETFVGPDLWSVHAIVPFSVFGLAPTQPFIPGMRVAVCRYDCTGGGEPVLSSTAPLREPNYHRIEDWPELVISPPDEGTACCQPSRARRQSA